MLQKLLSQTKISKKSIIFIYKGAVLLSAFSMFFLLYQMIVTGVLGISSENIYASKLSFHQAVKCLGWATFIHVVLIKLGVSIKGGAKHDLVFFIHLAFAITFTFLVTVLVYSFTATAPYHSLLTILASVSYTVVAFIGIPMLFKRF